MPTPYVQDRKLRDVNDVTEIEKPTRDDVE